MNKKEQAALEAALTAAAFHLTMDYAPDVVPPDRPGMLSTGFVPVGSLSVHPRVLPACSSVVHHGIGQNDKTSSQNPRWLYSTRTLALKALRREVELDCMQRLRYVDKMIEANND